MINNTAFFKKAEPCFMPWSKMIWDPIQKEGNPNQSSKVNELITKIKKFEVRKEGVVTKARRSIEFDGSVIIIILLQSSGRLLGRE